MSFALCPRRCLRFAFLLCHGGGRASRNGVFGDPSVAGKAGLQRERDLRCFVCLGILDGEGEKIFAVMAPGLGHQLGVGKAAFRAALGGLEAKITGVSFFSWVSGGLGWNMPFLPPLYPSRDRQDFLHSPLLLTASQGEIHPSLLRPALGHLFWLSAVPSLAYIPEEPNQFSLKVFSPAAIFTGLSPTSPR